MRYICFYYLYSSIILVPKCWTKCPWVLNIKMSLMPKGINEIIYNPGVFISTPEYVLIPYPEYPGGTIFFPCDSVRGVSCPLSVVGCSLGSPIENSFSASAADNRRDSPRHVNKTTRRLGVVGSVVLYRWRIINLCVGKRKV
jgi:hypothetical protein